MIAEKLGLKRVAAVCAKEDVTSDPIREALKEKRRTKWIWIAALVALCCALPLLWHTNNGEVNQPDSVEPVAVETVDTVMSEPETIVVEEIRKVPEAPKPEVSVPADNMSEIDRIVMMHYGPLFKRHEYLRELVADSTATSRQLLMMITKYVDDQTAAQDDIIKDAMEHYGLDNTLEAHSILGTSKEWSRFMKADSEISTLYSREIDRRD